MSDNYKRVTFTLYDDDIKKLNEWADKYKVSMSWIVRYLINTNQSFDKSISFFQLMSWNPKD